MQHRSVLFAVQRGVAAVEFALLLLLMVSLLFGLFVFWYVLQTHQTVTRATGDGARFLQEIVFGSDVAMNPSQAGGRLLIEQRVTKVVHRSLEEAGLVVTPQVQVHLNWTNADVKLEVEYPNALFAGPNGTISSLKVPGLQIEALRTTSVVMLP